MNPFILLLCCTPSPALAPSPSLEAFVQQPAPDQAELLKKEIDDTYKGYADAVVKGDLPKVMTFLTPDVVWIELGKRKEHDAVHQEMEGFLKPIKPGSKFIFTIEKFKVDTPEKVEAWVTNRMEVPGQAPRHASKTRFVWHDTWVKREGHWQNSIGELTAEKPKG